MPLHYIAWREALGEWNCGFEAKLFHEWGVVPIVEIVAALNKQRGLNMPVETVAGRKENLYFQLLPRLKAVPEVLEHIEAIHGQVPFAVVSGGALDSVTASLTTLNLLDRLEALVCAGDYKKAQARSGSLLASGFAVAWSAWILPGVRGHRNGHPSRHCRQNGFGKSAPTLGA